MQPQDPNQLPPVNNWQPQGPAPYSYGDLPPVDPSRQRRKKVLIFAGIILGALLLLGVIASLAGGGKNGGSGEYVTSSAQTSVELTNYDKDVFSMRYPKSLNIQTDEALDEQQSWYLSFQKSAETSDYDVAVLVGSAPPEYVNGEEAVNELVEESELTNVQTTEVVMAGVKAQKTVAEFTNGEQQFYIVYAHAQVGERHVEFTANYDKKLAEITDSLDVVLGSIKLK